MATFSAPLPQILFIEHSSAEQDLFLAALADFDFDVAVASNGEHGYALAQTWVPDLIILNVDLPGMDGLACCRLLQANPVTRKIPVIFLSETCAPRDRVAGLEAGAVDYMGQPFYLDELTSRIRIHLALSNPLPQQHPSFADDTRPFDGEDVLIIATQRLISSNLHSVPPLSEIAKQVGTYRERLNEVFKRRTGMSVFEFVRKRRVERSIELLHETTMEVKQVAWLMGFRSAANFATAFRRHTGLTPSAYRNSVHNTDTR